MSECSLEIHKSREVPVLPQLVLDSELLPVEDKPNVMPVARSTMWSTSASDKKLGSSITRGMTETTVKFKVKVS